METIRRIIGAARGGLLRHIQPGRLLRAAMPEVFPVTAAAALLAAYGMPAGMGSLFGAGGSYALPVLGIAFLCAIWCAGMNIYPAFAGMVLVVLNDRFVLHPSPKGDLLALSAALL